MKIGAVNWQQILLGAICCQINHQSKFPPLSISEGDGSNLLNSVTRASAR